MGTPQDMVRENSESVPGWKLPVAGLVILLLVGVGTFLPCPADPDLLFGLDRYRELGAASFLVAASVLLALLLLPGLAERVAGLFAGLKAVPPAVGAALTVAGSGALYWLLPNYSLSGDAGTVLMFATVGMVHPSNALASWLFSGTAEMLALDTVTAIRLVSTLSGMVYAAAAVGLGRECFGPGARRVGLTAVLLTTGTVALFFGTIEVYAPLVAAVAVFLLFGIRHLHGKGRGVAPAITLGIAFVLHGSAGLLLPALLVLAGRGRLLPLPIRRGLLFGLLFLLPVVATLAGLWFGTWEGVPPPPGPDLTGTFLGTGDEGPLLPLVRTPHEPTRRYAILDAEHWAGVANILLLVVPAGLALLAIGRRRFREPVPAFVGVAALFLALFPVFWNVSYDLRRDWDLFSMVGVPVALLGGLAFLSARGGGADVVRITALGIFCLAPFALGNHVLYRHRLRYAETMRITIGEALPRVACREAARMAMDAADEGGPPPPDLPPAEWRTSLERFGGTLLTRVRAFSEPELPNRLADVRLRIAAVLAREDFRSLHGGDPVGLAAEVAGALRRVADEYRAQNRPVPPAHVVAFFAVRHVVERADLRQLAPSATDGAALEPILLDAADEALEAAGGYDRGEMRVDADTVRTEARKEFAGSLGGLEPDPRWANVLADALLAALGPDERGERVRRLVAATERWLARERELRPPGQPQATLRMEWLWNEGHPEIAERLARHGLERDPGKARWLDLLGGVLIAQGRSTEGREILHRVIRAEPQLLRSRLRLSDDLITRGEKDEALVLMSRGLRISGYDHAVPAALVQLAWLRIERREVDIARSVLRTALRRLDRTPPTPYNDALRKQAEMLLERVERSSRG